MNDAQWKAFIKARDDFKKLCGHVAGAAPQLRGLQQQLVNERDEASYTIETPVVYNGALDMIQKTSDIKLLLVADNPGRREQSAAERSYLVGPSGKIADGFFKREAELGIDFRKNVIILNKTPVHTPRTVLLRTLAETGGEKIVKLIEYSQKESVKLLLDFYRIFKTPVWIIGYSEMKKRGLFEIYTRELCAFVSQKLIAADDVFFFRHFSMNQFTIDLYKKKQPGESTADALSCLGRAYRDRILAAIVSPLP
jgi:hypothetical protein